MEDLQEFILKTLDTHTSIPDTSSIEELNSIPSTTISSTLKSLESHEMIKFSQIEKDNWKLTEEGSSILLNGSHEFRCYQAISTDGPTLLTEITSLLGEEVSKIGLGKCFQMRWIKQADPLSVIRLLPDLTVDPTQSALSSIQDIVDQPKSIDVKQLKDLKKRKLVVQEKVISFSITKGPCFSLSLKKLLTDLTTEVLQGHQWKEGEGAFKAYNWNSTGAPVFGGCLHPLLKVREEFRQIFLEMGFSEMPTNRYVESSFWNFDSLFQPQQHPSRDAHDTFFLKNPSNCLAIPQDYMEVVKKVHESGFGCDSDGHQSEWKVEEARKNILRTHTTAISSQMLYRLAQTAKAEGEFKPAKYFSIDRVFRNETLDATHLAEFHQIEGLVADRGLTLGNLIGMLKEFFSKLGMNRLRFKPAFNPYTEPSMEVFAFHEGLGKWIELGNSGIFRPEMLLPMGLPSDVTVIAWGLSLERPTMIKYGISNIRDLFGHKVDLSIVRDNPVCRLNK